MASASTSKEFPGFDSIFQFGDPHRGSPFRGEVDLSIAQAHALFRGELHLSEPLRVKYALGGAPRDVIYTTSIVPLLVTRRVVDLMSEYRFTGWRTFEVLLYGKRDQLIEGYIGLAITGRCGAIDEMQAEIVIRDYPGGRFPDRKGKFFDPETWDGSDIFTSEGSVTKFAVDQVRKAFERAKVTNIVFERASEVIWPIE